MPEPRPTVAGEIVDESAHYSLKEMCQVCGVHAEKLVEMVEAGILDVQGERPTVWRFSTRSIVRSRKALRLQRDLELNLPGLAVTLDLLDQVESLRRQVKELRQHVENLQR